VAIPACASDVRIGINQPPGNGNDYPFVQQDNLGWTVLDVYLSYPDDACLYVFPFQFSIQPTATVPNPVFNVRIADANNVTVFTGTVTSGVTWDTTRYVGEVIVGDAVLRVVVHKPCFEAMTLNTWVTATYALDARTHNRLPKRLRSLRVGLAEYQEDLELVGGYNVDLEQRETTVTDGGRNVSQVYLDGVAGAGVGRLPGCDPDAQPFRLINRVGPDSFGNFNIEFDDCYRSQRRATVDYGQATPTATFATTANRHGLNIANDCRACHDCSYFVRTYRGLKVLWDRYATIATNAESVRDQFAANIARWNGSVACNDTNMLQVIFLAEPECRFFVGAMYCNNSNCCVAVPELRFTFFRYVNGVVTPVSSTVAVLKAFVELNSGSEEEVAPSVVWPVFSYKPDLVKAQNTFTVRLRFCTTCDTNESYGVYVSVHFESSAYTSAGCTSESVVVPASVTALWSASGLTTATTRALAFKLIPSNPEKEPFGCGCV
jgi:hypothetical protein